MDRDLPYVNVPIPSCSQVLLPGGASSCVHPACPCSRHPTRFSDSSSFRPLSLLRPTEPLHFLFVSCGQVPLPIRASYCSKLAYGSRYKLYSLMYLCGCGHVCADLQQCGLTIHHMDPTEALGHQPWQTSLPTELPAWLPP